MRAFLRALASLMKKNVLFAVGTVMFTMWIAAALLAPLIVPRDPLAQDLSVRFEPPSPDYWFGTDSFGRDIFSRVLAGSRISMTAGILTVVIALAAGSIYGAGAGYIGGAVDEILMRLSELVKSFPPLVLAMLIAATAGPGISNTLVAMVVVWWPNYARVMRSVVIAVKEREFVDTARVIGLGNLRIIFSEIFPNAVGTVLVMATLDIGNAILTFAGMSFLGLGASPPTPEWGAMVADGVENFSYWWISTFPGLAILSVALGANFVGDGLRDYLDPRLRTAMQGSG